MNLFTAFFSALLTSMLLVPPLRRHAMWLGLIDTPDARKVHERRIPRSGGLAIVVGALLPLVIFLPADPLLRGLILGGVIIVLFGYLDDRLDLDYRIKFLGQSLAALAAIQSGLVIEVWPFLGIDPVPRYLALPVTFLFLLGITNAINFSDGLDGLAGGIALVTLGAIALIASLLPGGAEVTLMALAIMGGVCGFLRYNNYPAVIFMGDTGSQFLGFMTGGLAAILTQHVDQALNPALVLLLVGLPVLDALSVAAWRIRTGKSPFRPDRNHFHHRLLDFGFRHYEAVATIYLVQGLMVLAAMPVRFESDVVVVGLFLLVSAAVTVFFRWARVSGWRLREPAAAGEFVERRNLWLRRLHWLPETSARVVELGVGALMLAAGFGAVPDRLWFSGASVAVGITLLATLRLRGPWRRHVRRGALYLSALVAVFLLQWSAMQGRIDENVLNASALALAAALVVAIRVTRRERFGTTPLDVLILLLVVVLLLMNESLDEAQARYLGDEAGEQLVRVRNLLLFDEAVARLVVMFYAIELLFSKGNRYLNMLSALAGIGMILTGVRAALA